jgi:solute carrier family 13 (sodium-dependent dicarboxylate transporter), member 2/3/5
MAASPSAAVAAARRYWPLAASGVLIATGHAGWISERTALSVAGERALAILILAALLWITEVVPLFVTSFVILLLELAWLLPGLPEAAGATGVTFLSPFFSDVVLLFLGGFVLSLSLGKYGLDERLARGVLARTGTSPARILLGMMAATAFLSMWMSNTATAAMMIALAVSILKHTPETDRYRKALLLGIPFSANLGGLATPVGSPPNAIALRYMQEAGIAPSFATWMLLTVPLVVVALAGTGWLLLRLHPTRLAAVDVPARESAPLKPRSRRVITVVLLTVLGWLTGDLHGMSNGMVALFPVVVLFGARFLTIPDLRALPWDVLLIVGGGLSLGAAVETSGLGRWFVSHVPSETADPRLLLAAVCVLAGGMSAVMSNTATATLLLPIVIGLGGVATAPLALGVAHACSVSMPLPVSTPPNAMVFSSGQISVRDMLVPGLIVSVASLLLAFTVAPLWWRLLGIS